MFCVFCVNTGHVKRVKDEDIKSLAIELQGRNMRYVCVSNLDSSFQVTQ